MGAHPGAHEVPLRPVRARGGGAGDAVSGRHGPQLRIRRVPGRGGGAQGAGREAEGRAQCLLRTQGEYSPPLLALKINRNGSGPRSYVCGKKLIFVVY